MAEQTAVEWLFEQLGSHIGPVDDSEAAKLNEYIAKAKQMHEKQTIDAYKHGQNNEFSHLMVGKLHITGEEYFEQTYKTQEHDKQQS